MVTVADDQFHLRTGDWAWSESGWFSLMVPERDLVGCIYVYFRPNMPLSSSGLILWDPGAEDIHTCLHWNLDPAMPIPQTAEMFNFDLASGLSIHTSAPLKSYRIGYEHVLCSMDVGWDAVIEPQEMTRVGGEVNPAFSGFWSDGGYERPVTGHFDQMGRMRGTLRLEGDDLKVDCFSMRDRTWGPRRLHPIRFIYDWGVASDTSGFLIQATGPRPVEADPIVGAVDEVTAGWYLRDGVVSRLVSGERRVLERDPSDGRVLRHSSVATDELGRQLEVEGTRRSQLRWTGYNNFMVHYGLAEYTLDGAVALGEMQEGFDFTMNRRLVQLMTQAPVS
jgi:hypothetical protein